MASALSGRPAEPVRPSRMVAECFGIDAPASSAPTAEENDTNTNASAIANGNDDETLLTERLFVTRGALD